jgi:hypothetical protein
MNSYCDVAIIYSNDHLATMTSNSVAPSASPLLPSLLPLSLLLVVVLASVVSHSQSALTKRAATSTAKPLHTVQQAQAIPGAVTS